MLTEPLNPKEHIALIVIFQLVKCHLYLFFYYGIYPYTFSQVFEILLISMSTRKSMFKRHLHLLPMFGSKVVTFNFENEWSSLDKRLLMFHTVGYVFHFQAICLDVCCFPLRSDEAEERFLIFACSHDRHVRV